MLLPFKTIRKSLLVEGRIDNYLKHALGKIILVVIGILIALQINNWNDVRLQGLAEKEFLQGVKKDLVQDMDYIDLDLIGPRQESFDRKFQIEFFMKLDR